MRPRTTTMLKRLGVIENKRHQKRRSGPVAMFPKLVSVDEWEVISVQQQRRLKANIKDDAGVDYSGIPELVLVPSE